MEDELLFLNLFTCLREAGLPLGIGEYQLLLQALQGGFGMADAASLKRLCRSLWVKSPEEDRLFEHHFQRAIAQASDSEPDNQAKSRSEASKRTPSSKLSDTAKSESSQSSTPYPDFGVEVEDEVQVAQAVKAVSPVSDLGDRPFLLTADYFPVTRRQMKQSWRYLRRPVREGAPTELDLEATINRLGRQGVLLEPVLLPQRVNRTELLLLLDQDGSMVPFHTLSHRLSETAVRGGRLGTTNIYYFHNAPVDYLYHDPHLLEAKKVSDLLTRLRSERTVALIFSDAGAARGGFNADRLSLTQEFLHQLRQRIRYIAWLNPMPKSRWQRTTAGEIAQRVPMFEVSRQGLDGAIDVLRGRRVEGMGRRV